MTLCIGIEQGRHVYIGADSASIAEDSYDVVRDPKVFLKNGWAVAHAGYWRLGDLLQYRLRLPKVPDNPADIVKTVKLDVVDELKKMIVENDIPMIEKDEPIDWFILIGAKGQLYLIDRSLHVERSKCKHNAIGTGAQYALGALDALDDSGLTAHQRMTTAFEITARRCTAIRGPYPIVKA